MCSRIFRPDVLVYNDGSSLTTHAPRNDSGIIIAAYSQPNRVERVPLRDDEVRKVDGTAGRSAAIGGTPPRIRGPVDAGCAVCPRSCPGNFRLDGGGMISAHPAHFRVD
jgi:hypothetical protein